MTTTGRFDRFRKAQVMGVRAYIQAGQHVLLCRSFAMRLSKHPKKEHVENSIIEFQIVQTNSTLQRVGERCSLVEVSSSEGYYGNVKAVTAGILGMGIVDMEQDPAFEDIFDAVWGEKQILVNQLVRCSAQQVKTSKGGDYTAKTWQAVPASMYAEFGLIAPDGAFQGEANDAPVIG